MKQISKMTCREIREEIIKNGNDIRNAKSLSKKRALINRGHDLMTELDRRYNRG